jgi:hypothetical protein
MLPQMFAERISFFKAGGPACDQQARAKGGIGSTNPLLADKLRASRTSKKAQAGESPFIFVSERGSPLR